MSIIAKRDTFMEDGCFAQRTARNLNEAVERFDESCIKCCMRNRDDVSCESCLICREYHRNLERRFKKRSGRLLSLEES